MKRRLTNSLAGLSLILALATGGLWGRSYWVYDKASYGCEDGRYFMLRSADGRFATQYGWVIQLPKDTRGWLWQTRSHDEVKELATAIQSMTGQEYARALGHELMRRKRKAR